MEEESVPQVSNEAVGMAFMNNLLKLASQGANAESAEEYYEDEQLLYTGAEDEDFTGFVKTFGTIFLEKVYGKQRPSSGNAYKDELEVQKYKCVVFLSHCGGRAKTLAQSTYDQLVQEYEDKNPTCDPTEEPPTAFFDLFVRHIKTLLGPQDALVYWHLQSQGVQLKSLTAEGLEGLIADLVAFLQRLVSAKHDLLMNLKIQAKENRFAGRGGDVSERDVRDVSAIIGRNFATPVPAAAFRTRARRSRRTQDVAGTQVNQMARLAEALRASQEVQQRVTANNTALAQENEELSQKWATQAQQWAAHVQATAEREKSLVAQLRGDADAALQRARAGQPSREAPIISVREAEKIAVRELSPSGSKLKVGRFESTLETSSEASLGAPRQLQSSLQEVVTVVSDTDSLEDDGMRDVHAVHVTPSFVPVMPMPAVLGTTRAPAHPDANSLWNLEENGGDITGSVNVLNVRGDGDDENSDEQEKVYSEQVKEYISKRLEGVKGERQLVNALGSSGISVQQPAQDPSLADLDIDERYVKGIIMNAVARFKSVYQVMKSANPKTALHALNLLARCIFCEQTRSYKRSALAAREPQPAAKSTDRSASKIKVKRQPVEQRATSTPPPRRQSTRATRYSGGFAEPSGNRRQQPQHTMHAVHFSDDQPEECDEEAYGEGEGEDRELAPIGRNGQQLYCLLCDSPDHWMQDCPALTEAKGMAKDKLKSLGPARSKALAESHARERAEARAAHVQGGNRGSNGGRGRGYEAPRSDWRSSRQKTVNAVSYQAEAEEPTPTALNAQAKAHVPSASVGDNAVATSADVPWTSLNESLKTVSAGVEQLIATSTLLTQASAAQSAKQEKAKTKREAQAAKTREAVSKTVGNPAGWSKSNSKALGDLAVRLGKVGMLPGGTEKINAAMASATAKGVTADKILDALSSLKGVNTISIHDAVHPTTASKRASAAVVIEEVSSTEATETPVPVNQLKNFTLSTVRAQMLDPDAMMHIGQHAVLSQSLPESTLPLHFQQEESAAVDPATCALPGRLGGPHESTVPDTSDEPEENRVKRWLLDDEYAMERIRDVLAASQRSGKMIRTTIKVRLEIVGPNDERVGVYALIDTGAEITVARKSILPPTVQHFKTGVTLSGCFVGGNSGCTKVTLGIEKDGIRYKTAFCYVSDAMAQHDLVLGLDWLRENRMLLQAHPNPDEEYMIFSGLDANGEEVSRVWGYKQTRFANVLDQLEAAPTPKAIVDSTHESVLHSVSAASASMRETLRLAKEQLDETARAFNEASWKSVIACEKVATVAPFGPCKRAEDDDNTHGNVCAVKAIEDQASLDTASLVDQVLQEVREVVPEVSSRSFSMDELPTPKEPPVIHVQFDVEATAATFDKLESTYEDEERRDTEGTGYGEGSRRACDEPPKPKPPVEPPPKAALPTGETCLPEVDPNRPLLERFVMNLGDAAVSAPALKIKARTSMRVPFSMRMPRDRMLAPRYIFEATAAMDKTTVLLEKTAVRAGDLEQFHLVFVNPTESEIVLPSGFEVATATRLWDPGMDRAPDGTSTAANKKTMRLFNKISSESSAKVLAGVQLRLNEVTQTDSKSDNGWKGLRYDRDDVEQVEALLKVLALDAMEFGDDESVEKRRERVRALLVEFIDVFAADNLSPGVSDFEPLRIDLMDPNARPVRSAPYRTTPLYRDFIAEQIEKLLKAGSIRPSYGPWASPVAVVRHPTGKLRMVCDYRRPNAVSKIDAHPLPDFEVILQQLSEMRFFSCVDLCSGYHQMPLDDASIEMSAITTHLGVFEWLVTPFGLASAPAHFSRCVGAMLAGMTYRNAVSFIDDILIYSPTFEQHLTDLREFFLRLRSHHVSLKPSKCDFFAKKASYLGFTLSKDGLEAVKTKVQAINDIPAPNTLTKLRSFIQMVNFYRRFIPNMSIVAKPLTDATRKENGPFKGWLPDSDCDKAFRKLKSCLTEAPLLRHARDDLPFIIEVDASEVGFGAVLCQDFPVQDVQDVPGVADVKRPTVRLPIHYASRKTKGGEPRYAPSHLEACAVLWALDYFRHFHHGRPTKVLTDHGPLRWLMTTTSKENSLLARYALRLQAYAPFVSIDYKPGRINSAPDSLSRLPVNMDGDTKSLEGIVVPDEYYIHTLEKRCRDAAIVDLQTDALLQKHGYGAAPAFKAPVWARGLDGLAKIKQRGPQFHGTGVTAWERPFHELYSALPFMQRVLLAQDNCPGLRDLRDYLEDSDRGRSLPTSTKTACEAHRKNWVVDSGILRRVVRVPALKDKAGNVTRQPEVLTPIALPDESPLHEEILRSMHDHPTASHIGEKKMTSLMRPRFYWSGWDRAVKDYCKSCDMCQRYKALRSVRPSHVMPMHFPTPWHTINIDLIGPLPMSRGKHYAMTCIDHFSNWPEIVPLASKEPKVVAQGIYDYCVMRHTVPVVIITDNGGEFKNKVIEHLSKLLGVDHRFTAPYHPATNGKVERFNRFVKKGLAMIVATFGKGWTHYTEPLAFAYRHAPVFSTGKSPHEIARGFPGRLPVDLLTTPQEQLEMDSTRFHAAHLLRFSKVWEQVRQLRENNVEEWNEMTDNAKAYRVFHEGTQALIYMPPDVKGPAAFVTCWRGPFHVLKRLGPKTYKLQAADSDRVFSVSVDNMVPYHPRKPFVGPVREPGHMDNPLPASGGATEVHFTGARENDGLKQESSAAQRPMKTDSEHQPDLRRDSELLVEKKHDPKQQPDLRRDAEPPQDQKRSPTQQPDLRREPDDLEQQPDLRRDTAQVQKGRQPHPRDGSTFTTEDFKDAFAGGDFFTGMDPAMFGNAEDDLDIPFAQQSHAQRTKLVKLCVSILSEVNMQVQVKRSTIQGIARDAPYGAFAKKRLRKGLIIGQYRGRTIGKEEYEAKYPPGAPARYCLEVRPNLFIDAEDPREAGFGRFINDPGANGRPNCVFHRSKDKVLIQTLRDIMPGEELFVYYGKEYGWRDGERKASKHCDRRPTNENGGRLREELTHPRGGMDVATEAKLADHVDAPDVDTSPEIKLPTDAPHYEDGHDDFEENSCVLYDNAEGPNWLCGEVVGVDHTSPVLEVHRYGSMGLREGKEVADCIFKPAYIDPRDGLQVYTTRALPRYRPILDLIEFKDIVARDFYLTNKAKLPLNVRKLVLMRPPLDFSQ
jgi:hypothetical protein